MTWKVEKFLSPKQYRFVSRLNRFSLLFMCGNFRSMFESYHHHAPSYVKFSSEKSVEQFQVNFIRLVAIMHDKLNDAIEIVNESFSKEVKSDLIFHCRITEFLSTSFSRTVVNLSTSFFFFSIRLIIFIWRLAPFNLRCIISSNEIPYVLWCSFCREWFTPSRW